MIELVDSTNTLHVRDRIGDSPTGCGADPNYWTEKELPPGAIREALDLGYDLCGRQGCVTEFRKHDELAEVVG